MTNEEYVRLQDVWLKAAGVKVGSWVKVTRKADSHESGWNNLWSSAMDAVVGTFVQVLGSWDTNGIEVASGKFSPPSYRLPFFILDPTGKSKPEKYMFKPFEQVLVRDEDASDWVPDFFRSMLDSSSSGYPFNCFCSMWKRCIPYAGHEHLLSTTDKPEDWARYYDKE